MAKKKSKSQKKDTKEVKVWGTGNASREFLYVKDAAEAIYLATQNYNNIKPLNIGTGKEISIRNIVNYLIKLYNYNGRITYLRDKPEGQLRRQLDVSRAKNEIGFVAKTNIKDGLKETIDWYKNSISL